MTLSGLEQPQTPDAEVVTPTDWPQTAGGWGEVLEAALDRCARATSSAAITADDVEIFWQRRDRLAINLCIEGPEPHILSRTDHVVCRVALNGAVGVAVAGPDEDIALAIERAKAARVPTALGLAGPPGARRPTPMVFDPALVEQGVRPGFLDNLADAMVDNLRHESERIGGLRRLDGEVSLCVDQLVVGRRAGTIGMQRAHFAAEVDLNGCGGEQTTLVAAPESWLGVALMAARTWRTLPDGAPVVPHRFKVGPGDVILHPRAFERLLRALFGRMLTLDARGAGELPWGEGELVTDPAFTAVDDPGLDGFATSRPFDDEGLPTQRRALFVQGRLVDVLRGRTPAGTGPRATSLRSLDDPATLKPGLTALLVERGTTPFHDLVDAMPRGILVQALGAVSVEPDGTFSAPIRWGLALERGRHGRVLAPGRWVLRGRLFGGPAGPGMLERLALTRELVDTGTAVLPYVLCGVTAGGR